MPSTRGSRRSTPPTYGSGISERVLGKAVGRRRADVRIATKAGYLFTERSMAAHTLACAAARRRAAAASAAWLGLGGELGLDLARRRRLRAAGLLCRVFAWRRRSELAPARHRLHRRVPAPRADAGRAGCHGRDRAAQACREDPAVRHRRGVRVERRSMGAGCGSRHAAGAVRRARPAGIVRAVPAGHRARRRDLGTGSVGRRVAVAGRRCRRGSRAIRSGR